MLDEYQVTLPHTRLLPHFRRTLPAPPLHPDPREPAGGALQCGTRGLAGRGAGRGGAVVAIPVGQSTVGVVVDTSECRFEGSPRYHASLYASSHHWIIFSAGDIENPNGGADGATSPDSIRLTLRSSAADGVSAAMARQHGWQVRWCGYGATTKRPPTYSVCCGSSAATAWTDYGTGSYVDVATDGCGWTDGPDADRMRPPPPYYFSSLSDTSCGSRIGDGCSALAGGVNSIYSATATGFRVYVKPASTYWTQAAKAKANNWRLNWCGVKVMPPSSGAGAEAGYPCEHARAQITYITRSPVYAWTPPPPLHASLDQW